MEKINKNYNLIIGVISLIVIIIIAALIGYFVSKPKSIVIQGEVEASEYRLSGKVPGRIDAFLYKEGDWVQRGDTLVILDSPEVKAKLAQAQAAKNMAEAQKKKAFKGARSGQITAVYELWQQALVNENIMIRSFDRAKILYDKKVISAQTYDEAKAKMDAAIAQCKAAKSQYEMIKEGVVVEDKTTAQALVDKANAVIMEVDAYLSELNLIAPANGIITTIFPKIGELVGTGAPIMTITDLSDLWFTFNVREEFIGQLSLDTELSLYVPALKKNIRAKVNYISARESYATWRATKAQGEYDSKTFEIRAIPMDKVDNIYPGMSVIIKFE